MRLSSTLAIGVALLGLAACATVPAPPPPPAGEGMAAQPRSPAGVNKRQYFDEKRGRFYYFDQKRGAYFWENGAPRS